MKTARNLILLTLVLAVPASASAESTIMSIGSVPQKGPVLGAAATDGSSPARRVAFKAPATMNPTKLYHMSKSADPAARLHVANAIRRSTRPEIVHAARVLVNDPDVRVRRVLTESLAQKTAKRWIPLLTKAFGDKDAEVRIAAAKGLVQYGPEAYLDAMTSRLNDPSPAVRRIVLDSLMAAGKPGLEALVAIEIGAEPASDQMIAEVDETLHRYAADHGDELAQMLDLSTVDRRHAQRVANLLADCGPMGTNVLLAEMDAGLSQRAFYARRALTAYPGSSVKAINRRLMNVDLKETKSALITPYFEILAAAGDARALPGLKRLVTSRRPYLRSEGMLVLGHIQDDRAVALLIEGLQDPEADVRGAAATALGTQKSEKGIKPLIRVVARGDAVAVKAIRALGEIGDARAALVLERQLDSDNPVVRRYACEALERIGHRSAVKGLASRLDDPDAMVRYTASRALGSFE